MKVYIGHSNDFNFKEERYKPIMNSKLKEEERITKIKALKLFETGELNSFEVGIFAGLAQIHQYLFEDVYEFAGIIRTENI